MQHPIHQRSRTLPRRIADHFEQEIREGRLRENDRLPSTAELARQFGVNRETIQQSMRLLTRQGLLERAPGRGSFIRRGLAQKSVGIIFGRRIFTRPDQLFFGTLLRLLIERADDSGWSYRLFPVRDSETPEQELEPFRRECGQLDAAIEFCIPENIRQALLRNCPLPLSSCLFRLDAADLLEQAGHYLAKHGFRHPLALSPGRMPDLEHARIPAETEVTLCAADPLSDSAEAYRLVRRHLAARPECDALIVLEDSLYVPAVQAAFDAGRRIPETLGLVTHVNRGVEPFFPLPLTRLEIDPADVALQVWNQLQALLRGEPELRPTLRPRLIPGRTCGEAHE